MRLHGLTTLSLAVAVAALSLHPAPAAAASEYLSHERETFDNGLDLVLHVDRKLPLVAINLSYHVGSMHDGAHTGLAHLVEHLMFRGTLQLLDGGLPSTYQDAGATFNATTTPERTSYHALLPAANLPTALWLEANRMSYMLPALTSTKVREEMATTMTEWRSKTEGSPGGRSRVALWDALFPLGHPLYDERPETIQTLSQQDVEAFVNAYYGPANATLVLAGDLPDDVRSWVHYYFDQRSGGAAPTVPTVTRPASAQISEQTGEQRIVRRSELATYPLVAMAWLTPPVFAPGDAEADIFATMLNKKLLDTVEASHPGLIRGVSARQFSLPLESAFMITVEGPPESGPQQMLEAVEAAVDSLRQTALDATEVERASKRLALGSLRSLQGLNARAERMQLYIGAGKPPDWLDEDLARYESLTPAAVTSFVDTYLVDERRTIVLAYPAEAKP